MADQTTDQIKFPERLVGSVDLSRTIRELEALDESLRQAEIRKPGEPTHLARSSVTLEETARINNVQLTDRAQREQLLEVLKAFLIHAPRIRISVAAEPTAKFNQKLLIWLRANIHPLVLLEIGLQPTLAAGCMVRTTNKIFDLSLRQHFSENRGLLVQKITEIGALAEKKDTDLEAAMLAKAAAEADQAIAAVEAQPAAAQPAPAAPAPAAAQPAQSTEVQQS